MFSYLAKHFKDKENFYLLPILDEGVIGSRGMQNKVLSNTQSEKECSIDKTLKDLGTGYLPYVLTSYLETTEFDFFQAPLKNNYYYIGNLILNCNKQRDAVEKWLTKNRDNLHVSLQNLTPEELVVFLKNVSSKASVEIKNETRVWLADHEVLIDLTNLDIKILDTGNSTLLDKNPEFFDYLKELYGLTEEQFDKMFNLYQKYDQGYQTDKKQYDESN